MFLKQNCSTVRSFARRAAALTVTANERTVEQFLFWQKAWGEDYAAIENGKDIF